MSFTKGKYLPIKSKACVALINSNQTMFQQIVPIIIYTKIADCYSFCSFVLILFGFFIIASSQLSLLHLITSKGIDERYEKPVKRCVEK